MFDTTSNNLYTNDQIHDNENTNGFNQEQYSNFDNSQNNLNAYDPLAPIQEEAPDYEYLYNEIRSRTNDLPATQPLTIKLIDQNKEYNPTGITSEEDSKSFQIYQKDI